MRRVRCYRCKDFTEEAYRTPFHLKHKGHTRLIYLCDDCVSFCVTKVLRHVLTEGETKKLNERIHQERKLMVMPTIQSLGGTQ